METGARAVLAHARRMGYDTGNSFTEEGDDLIDQRTAERVLLAALSCGADFSELYLEDTESNVIGMSDGRVENAAYTRRRGAGVRVLQGTRSAYAYTADTGEAALLATAKAAAAALQGAPAGTQVAFAATSFCAPMAIPFASVDNDRRVRLLREATGAARAVSAEITQVQALYMDKVRRTLVCNSEGVFAAAERPYTRAYLSAIAMQGTEAQTGFEGPGCCRGFEAYTGEIDLNARAEEAARTAVTMLHAPDCPAGRLPVVIDGGFGGVIFHEACGHSLEATSVAKGDSEFCGKLGQKIAADCVSAVDDGTMPGEWGSIDVDDEGTPSRRNLLIENGVLRGYLIDLLGARRMGMPVTGSSRRQDYTFAPTSRMTNTFICPGQDDEAEMIATMGEGLYAKKMGGGSVNPLTGEFNFAVSEGYWVRDGKLLSPVRGATLIGRGAEVLQRIDRVGPRMWMGQGMCGSLSGSVPTNVGQPRIRVTEITVGGKGGKLS